jgi:predicted phosphodiesterase
MRVAIFSDMHGNNIALEAVLADFAAQPADQLVCLGDAIQSGPQPAAVLRRLRELGCPVVLGNADAWLLSGEHTGAEVFDPVREAQMNAVRQWTLSQLSAADQAFIAGFQPTVTLALGDGQSLLGFHGSPHSFDDVILPTTPEPELRQMLDGFAPAILAGGHTHIQQLRHLGTSFYVGCGSAGYAYRHNQPEGPFRADPWAEYAILRLEQGRLGLEFRRVPFDVEALIVAYQRSDRPHADVWAAQYQ